MTTTSKNPPAGRHPLSPDSTPSQAGQPASRHTPGPLEIRGSKAKRFDESGDYAIVDSEGKIIGEAFALVGHGVTRPAYANAKLWAAAPRLLEALKEIKKRIVELDGYEMQWPVHGVLHSLIEEARAAISEAEGEA